MQEEFAAIGIPYAERGPRTDECIEVYKRSWTDAEVSYQGRFYQFASLSMDPKPRQQPPPIIYGGVTPAAPGGRTFMRRLLSHFSRSVCEADRYAKNKQ